MARSFNVPDFYRSGPVAVIKRAREQADPKKRDVSPSVLDFGPVRFKLARHFGFCFGVQNAIEIAYRAIEQNPNKRIFLLSEMIHNPQVNADLQQRGVQFLLNTDGSTRMSLSELTPQDIVIVPAFGTTVEIQHALQERGIDPYFYDTTCPFVEKVWKRSDDLGRAGFTVIVHGKQTHEETRATFSHSKETAPTLVVLNMEDTEFVIETMQGRRSQTEFFERFHNSLSAGFDPARDLKRIGVVNQTTMLATETQAIANRFREAMLSLYGPEALKEHFADTRDTLCYATHENQTATRSLIDSSADLAIVVGGYNSSNTSHLVELCEERIPTFYIKDATEILDAGMIRHFDVHSRAVQITTGWLPEKRPLEIALTAGASCPDRTVDEVIQRVASILDCPIDFAAALRPYTEVASGSILPIVS